MGVYTTGKTTGQAGTTEAVENTTAAVDITIGYYYAPIDS